MRKFVKITKYLNENKRITNTKILLSKKTKIEIITQKIITKTQKDEKQGKNSNGNENSTQQGKNNGEIPQQKNDNSESKLPKDIENALLNQIKEKEQETTRRILNKNSVSVPRSREKDW